MNKGILFTLLIVIIVVFGIIAFAVVPLKDEQFSTSYKVEMPTSTPQVPSSTFKGPTGAPSVKGPTELPPQGNQ
jgi:cytochrome c oxidase assembly protein Cox11